jgi:hypothetical protein
VGGNSRNRAKGEQAMEGNFIGNRIFETLVQNYHSVIIYRFKPIACALALTIIQYLTA